MGWRLAALALAWLAGTAAHLQLRSLPTRAECAVILGAVVALQALALRGRWRHRFALGVVVLGLTSFAVSSMRASHRLDQALDERLEGVDLVVTGIVASLPRSGSTGLRFAFAVESASLGGNPVSVPTTLTIGWFLPPQGPATLSESQRSLAAGQRWRFNMRLRRPHGNFNPHGFDHELKLFEQGIGATGAVRDKPPPRMLDQLGGFPVERARQRVKTAIEAQVSDPRAAGVLVALTVGDQGAIERQDWDIYRATGIAHLVAISGLHIAMFAWLASAATARLWRCSGRAMLFLPAPVAAAWAGLGCAAAYAVFSGGGLPAQRTIWMLGVVTLSRSLGLRWPAPLVLLLAAVVVTVFDPWALLQPGFWLSFTAVGLLMASSPVAQAPPDPDAPAAQALGWRGQCLRLSASLQSGLRTQIVATVGLAPLTLVFFQQISLVGFVANLIAIPVVTLCVLPLALFGVVVPGAWAACAWVVTQLGLALGWLARLPGAVWVVPVAPAWAQFAGLAGAALAIMPLPWRLRGLAALLILPMLAPPRALPPEGGFDLVAADVGQGTAALVRTRRHLLVFDTGPRYSADGDAGGRVLLPLLKALGETRIDRMVLSHRDVDHVGGAESLLNAVPVTSLSSSLEPDHPLLESAAAAARAFGRTTRTTRCEAGETWDWDGVQFEILQPPADAYEKKLKPNALSCVLRVSAGERSLLLAGDIERPQEAALVNAMSGALRSDLLLVPHHGSKTSSTVPFLDAVRPRVAVFQAGYRNRFGHPAREIVARYAARGVLTRDSPSCGAFTVRWSDPVEGRCERDIARRYWHPPPRLDQGPEPPPYVPGDVSYHE